MANSIEFCLLNKNQITFDTISIDKPAPSFDESGKEIIPTLKDIVNIFNTEITKIPVIKNLDEVVYLQNVEKQSQEQTAALESRAAEFVELPLDTSMGDLPEVIYVKTQSKNFNDIYPSYASVDFKTNVTLKDDGSIELKPITTKKEKGFNPFDGFGFNSFEVISDKTKLSLIITLDKSTNISNNSDTVFDILNVNNKSLIETLLNPTNTDNSLSIVLLYGDGQPFIASASYRNAYADTETIYTKPTIEYDVDISTKKEKDTVNINCSAWKTYEDRLGTLLTGSLDSFPVYISAVDKQWNNTQNGNWYEGVSSLNIRRKVNIVYDVIPQKINITYTMLLGGLSFENKLNQINSGQIRTTSEDETTDLGANNRYTEEVDFSSDEIKITTKYEKLYIYSKNTLMVLQATFVYDELPVINNQAVTKALLFAYKGQVTLNYKDSSNKDVVVHINIYKYKNKNNTYISSSYVNTLYLKCDGNKYLIPPSYAASYNTSTKTFSYSNTTATVEECEVTITIPNQEIVNDSSQTCLTYLTGQLNNQILYIDKCYGIFHKQKECKISGFKISTLSWANNTFKNSVTAKDVRESSVKELHVRTIPIVERDIGYNMSFQMSENPSIPSKSGYQTLTFDNSLDIRQLIQNNLPRVNEVQSILKSFTTVPDYESNGFVIELTSITSDISDMTITVVLEPGEKELVVNIGTGTITFPGQNLMKYCLPVKNSTVISLPQSVCQGLIYTNNYIQGSMPYLISPNKLLISKNGIKNTTGTLYTTSDFEDYDIINSFITNNNDSYNKAYYADDFFMCEANRKIALREGIYTADDLCKQRWQNTSFPRPRLFLLLVQGAGASGDDYKLRPYAGAGGDSGPFGLIMIDLREAINRGDQWTMSITGGGSTNGYNQNGPDSVITIKHNDTTLITVNIPGGSQYKGERRSITVNEYNKAKYYMVLNSVGLQGRGGVESQWERSGHIKFDYSKQMFMPSNNSSGRPSERESIESIVSNLTNPSDNYRVKIRLVGNTLYDKLKNILQFANSSSDKIRLTDVVYNPTMEDKYSYGGKSVMRDGSGCGGHGNWAWTNNWENGQPGCAYVFW